MYVFSIGVKLDLLLGIDAGTTSVKSGLYNPAGQCLAISRKEYQLATPRPSWAELDPEIYWRSCVFSVQSVLKQVDIKDVIAISVSSQGETIIAVDKSGVPVYPAIVWLDNRAENQAAYLATRFGNQAYERTGIPEILPTWSACKILWLKENAPEAFSRVNHFLLVQDYLIYKLTGEYTTNGSVSCTSLFYDIREHNWWDDLLSELGISKQQLPALIPPGTVINHISPEASAQTGLSQTAVVVGGGMDQSIGAIGAGNIHTGVVSETTGAASTIQVTLPSLDANLQQIIPIYCHSVPNEYLYVPVCPTAGITYKWFRDKFVNRDNLTDEVQDVPYDLLNEMAEDVPPGCDGLILLPHLMGAYSPNPNPAARGSFTGFTLSHTRSHFIRAILESVAFLLKKNLDVLQTAGVAITEIRSTGGGARSRLWNQIKSNVCNLPVVSLQNEDTALVGNAILAGVAAGLFDSIESGCAQMVRIKDKVVPDDQVDQYRVFYQRYCDLDQTLGDYFTRQYKQ